MNRRKFIQNTALLAAATSVAPKLWAEETTTFPVVRTPLSKRKFTSEAVEKTIAEVHVQDR